MAPRWRHRSRPQKKKTSLNGAVIFFGQCQCILTSPECSDCVVFYGQIWDTYGYIIHLWCELTCLWPEYVWGVSVTCLAGKSPKFSRKPPDWLVGGIFFFGAWYHRYPIFIHIHMDIRYMMYPYLSHISLVIFTRKKVTVSRNWNYQTLHNTAALLTFIFVVNLNMELNTGLKLGEAQRSGSVLSISQRCGFNKNHNPCPLHVR